MNENDVEGSNFKKVWISNIVFIYKKFYFEIY